MTLGDVIKNYRNANHLNMGEFATRCGLSKGYISMLENNINPRNNKPIAPTLKAMSKISIGMGVSLDELLKAINRDQLVRIESEPEQPTNTINVYGRVAAGVPIEAIEDVIDTEEIPESLARSGEYFGLIIKGDSMEPRIKDGDVVIVRKQSTAENGDIVIATINGENAACKRLRKYRDGIELVSNNPSYEPMYFSNEEIEKSPVTILGKVVELRARF